MKLAANTRTGPKRTIRLRSIFVIPGVVVTAIVSGILVFTIAAIQLQESRQEFRNRSRIIHGLFGDGITQDVLLGQRALVYGRCKALLEQPNVAGVMVLDSTRQALCEMGSFKQDFWHFKVSSDLHFQPSSEIAGTVIVNFDLSPLRTKLITTVLVTLALGALAMSIQVSIFLFLSNLVLRPIQALSEAVGTRDLKTIRELRSEAASIHIDELQSLSESTKEMATQIIGLQQKEIEAERSRALTDMAAQVSHDIRSPVQALNVVMSSSKELDPEVRSIAQSAVSRINKIANDLLAMSKSGGRIQQAESPVAEPIDVKGCISSLIVEKRLEFKSRSEVDLSVEFSEVGQEVIQLNEVDLARLISNLINNAYEAISGSGQVRVSVAGYSDRIQLMVIDSGEGIDPALLEQLGQKGASFGKAGTSGNGLGLYSARQTVQRAGGKLEIRSKKGSGTLVVISIPKVLS